MPLKFSPVYSLTHKITNALVRIEAAKQHIKYLPITPTLLASLRESARLLTTHYSTAIEGNRLSSEQIEQVIKHKGHFPGRERDEHEVMGYYAGLNQIELWVTQATPISEKIVQTLHALVMSSGKTTKKTSPYRKGQNVIHNGRGTIIYLPPEAKDVPLLMSNMIAWINRNSTTIACPIVASIAHYQFATIHPYFDGNGRTARLLTTMILHLGGYDLKGLYALEEYYARNLTAYYNAISVGTSHNYYTSNRADADITSWIEYFLEGMAVAFENILKAMAQPEHRTLQDHTSLIFSLDPKQRKALELLRTYAKITSQQVGDLFGFKPRTSSKLCKEWVESGFLEVVTTAKKGRTYKIGRIYERLI